MGERYSEDQTEEENEEKWRKMGENNKRMRKNGEMVLSCPPEVESLATPLNAWGEWIVLYLADWCQHHVVLHQILTLSTS